MPMPIDGIEIEKFIFHVVHRTDNYRSIFISNFFIIINLIADNILKIKCSSIANHTSLKYYPSSTHQPHS